jgi:hypothetical protein
VNALAIGEQQRVAHVEENDFEFRVHSCTASHSKAHGWAIPRGK